MRMIRTFAAILTFMLLLASCNSNEDNNFSGNLSFAVSENINSDTADLNVRKYSLGDIILLDGSISCASDYSSIDNNNPPIAIVAAINNDGTVMGLGVHRSENSLQWAPEDTVGYTMDFTDITAVLDGEEESNADTAIFKGDTDGSDNFDVIKTEDESGAEDAYNYYPAFDFINTYADNYNLTGNYTSGWYMPSIDELCTVYKNRDIINISLQKIYELDNTAAMDGLGTNWYWSSSQSVFDDNYVWFVHYFNGYVSDCPKSLTNLHVLAVRKF